MTYSPKPLNLGGAGWRGRHVAVSPLRHNDRRMPQSDRSTPRLCSGRVVGKVATPLGTSRRHRTPVQDRHAIDAVWQLKEDVRAAMKDTLVWKWKSYLKKRSRLISFGPDAVHLTLEGSRLAKISSLKSCRFILRSSSPISFYTWCKQDRTKEYPLKSKVGWGLVVT